MPIPESDTPQGGKASAYHRVSHGYAPDGRPITPPPIPLRQIVDEVVENASATAKAELALLEARSELALHGISWTAGWGTIAACAIGIAMLAMAFGAILALAPHVGPLFATLIVVAVLLALAAFAGWRAQVAYADIRTALRRDLTNEEPED